MQSGGPGGLNDCMALFQYEITCPRRERYETQQQFWYRNHEKRAKIAWKLSICSFQLPIILGLILELPIYSGLTIGLILLTLILAYVGYRESTLVRTENIQAHTYFIPENFVSLNTSCKILYR